MRTALVIGALALAYLLAVWFLVEFIAYATRDTPPND
jgi:hypothetical protein